MKYKFLIASILFISSCLKIQAQDPNFTQYFSAPLTLNPANAGFFDGNARVAFNQRQQWWNVGANYSTTSISADFKILRDYIPYDDTFGIGISGMFDKSLGGALESNYLSLTSAYHKSLAHDGSQTLAVGFQATFANRFIDYNLLSFASQYNFDFFDPTISAGINYSNSSAKYIDINTGLLYAVHSERANMYLGVSLYHANKPKESLFDPAGYQVPFRKTAHAGGEIMLNEQSSVLFSGVYMSQGKVTDKLLGAAYGLKAYNAYDSNGGTELYFGLWYRFNESFIPYVGLDYSNFSIGANYTLNTPTVSTYRPRTFEISLIYRHKTNEREPRCPRF